MRIDHDPARGVIASFLPMERKSAGRGCFAHRLPQPGIRLLDAVMRLAGPRAELLKHAERPWASATFSGTRHTITLTFAGEAGIAAGEAFAAALPEHEFAIRRQLVADAAIVEMEQGFMPTPHMLVEAELLLLEDG